MKLLLHVCCGPCLTAFNDFFKEKGIEFAAYFHNPNIHPYKEYLRRRDTLSSYAKEAGITAIIDESFMEHKWEQEFKGLPAEERCRRCYAIRINKTAAEAKSTGFSHFTTTLLISPYQDHDSIKNICEKAAEKNGTVFYYDDFIKMFREGQNLARGFGLYMQKYCGCIYSLEKSKFKDKITWD